MDASRDISFPGFPTFPVVNEYHFKIFPKRLLPSQFINQGGDPYLYALYLRFSAACFVVDVFLNNKIGGLETSRYEKRHIRWNNEILTTSVQLFRIELKFMMKDKF